MHETCCFLTTLFAPYSVLNAPDLRLEVRSLAPLALLSAWEQEGRSEEEIGRGRAQSAHFVLEECGLEGASNCARHLAKERDVYVGVLPRTGRGRYAVDVPYACWLWCEVDGKDAGAEGAKGLVEAALGNGLPFPAMIVNSGGGVHVYWPLAAPVRFDDAVSRSQFKETLRRLAWAVGGLEWEQDAQGRVTGKLKPVHAYLPYADPTCCEPARILRIPGTFNHKPQRQSVVTFDSFNPDAPRWTLAHWNDYLPAQPRPAPYQSPRYQSDRLPGELRGMHCVNEPRALPRKTLDDLSTRFPDGQKYDGIRKILHTARRNGWSAEALELLGETFINTHQCDPRPVRTLVQDTMRRIVPEG